MPYVNVPNDLSKIKTKMAFNLTKRQLVCFGSAGAVGIPAYLLTRGTLGNTGAMFLMLGIMLPAFLLAMYEKDGLPFEKVVRNIIRAKFLRPGIRAYRTENIYAPFAGPGAGKEDVTVVGVRWSMAIRVIGLNIQYKEMLSTRFGYRWPGDPVCPTDNPVSVHAPGRCVQAPGWALYKNCGI